ncbi:TBC1 domain family member 8B-like isoform X2 [Juglans microcarpa x Juglans regia]|uniref:TBC1 domain family member 8B-like isoform X2 n=1 Tax=Juglans microcarpa x Juglans regia TaxID=2249226 RepID=UPI001B7EF86C|nr:TBC1 domain family member 8B-like isoform X2 [Juglans microcarpa x Juglans regia]
MTELNFSFIHILEPRRDAYGFALRPQHAQRYIEYANIYKEEEGERSDKWKDFLEQLAQSPQPCSSEEEPKETLQADATECKAETISEGINEVDASSGRNSISDGSKESDPKEGAPISKETKTHKVQTWTQIKPSLGAIEHMMTFRVRKRKNTIDERENLSGGNLPPIEETEPSGGASEEELEGVNKTLDDNVNAVSLENAAFDEVSPKQLFPWMEELESLVRGGVPKDLRGEVWQAFVGVKVRRVERYYQDLLDHGESKDHDESSGVPKKWKRQIEKDIPRTFPGHPALDENGRDSLRRVLLAYARHNPSVGYCQAMNFFAGLLLLLMPEENAFWTLVGILDDYFGGYYTEEMIESQVAWISGPWFLSIFVNMLPWESVFRVWDVLLFEGNRVMLFQTALALMELYGPALVTTKDAGDAITLLQSLAGSTFDSSQLVLTACMGYVAVTEVRLQELRQKHRPAVLAIVEERSKGGRISKDSKGLASKLYSFKHDPGSLVEEKKSSEGSDNLEDADKSHLGSRSSNLDELLNSLSGDSDVDSLPDLQEQVVWLKVELCRLLEEKRAAVLRAEELETALMEMVKQDNRRQLSARVEHLEGEIAELKQALSEKREQEAAMLQVLMRVEQEQRVTEDARLSAEQDAAAQRYAVHVLQEKYEKAMASLAETEKRVVIAESMLEATLQYESGQSKAQSSPGAVRNQDTPTRKVGLLSFGLGWRDRNKGKPSNAQESSESKSTNEGTGSNSSGKENKNEEQET